MTGNRKLVKNHEKSAYVYCFNEIFRMCTFFEYITGALMK